nr:immunoglobulin heavy chain junction region [Macaca mulatta]MOV58387.1 immunoglobulin heavy chain junction region [Macaca mulatta]
CARLVVSATSYSDAFDLW